MLKSITPLLFSTAGNDRRESTHWLRPRIRESIRVRLNDLPLNLIRPTTIIPQTTRTHANVDLRYTKRLAIIQALNSSQLLKILLEQIGKLDKKTATGVGGDFAP